MFSLFVLVSICVSYVFMVSVGLDLCVYCFFLIVYVIFYGLVFVLLIVYCYICFYLFLVCQGAKTRDGRPGTKDQGPETMAAAGASRQTTGTRYQVPGTRQQAPGWRHKTHLTKALPHGPGLFKECG